VAGEIRFDDPGAGGEAAVDDQFPNLIESFSQAVAIVIVSGPNYGSWSYFLGWHNTNRSEPRTHGVEREEYSACGRKSL
jgi:hypothetical protein